MEEVADNAPEPFDETLVSGARAWGPGRLELGRRQKVASASNPPTEMPDGSVRRFFDIEALHAELVVQYAEDPEAGWTVTDAGKPVEMTRAAIRGIKSAQAQADIMDFGLKLMVKFYPQYFRRPPGEPSVDVQLEGESNGDSEKPARPPTSGKGGSGRSRKTVASRGAKTT